MVLVVVVCFHTTIAGLTLYPAVTVMYKTHQMTIPKLERDPENGHRFILKIDGVSVFRWFRDMARKLLEKMRIRISSSRKGPSIGR